MIGYMPMPEGFRYQKECVSGRPPISYKHPSMDTGRRAKLFSPFDALLGFDEAIDAKRVLYQNRQELNEAQRDELNRRLLILQTMTGNSRLARENRVWIQVTYFVPCTDKNHTACGRQGQYITAAGTCRGVDPVNAVITVDDMTIPLSDIISIEAESGLLDSNAEAC